MPRKKKTKEEVEKVAEKDSEDNKPAAPASAPIMSKEQVNQFWWVIGTMLFLLAVFFLTYYIVKGTPSFTYKGLSFTKEKFGEIPLYHYYYSFVDGGQNYVYHQYLRIDPRKNNVPINVGEINYPSNKRVYLTYLVSDLQQCSDTFLGIQSLVIFFSGNQIDVKGGTPNATEAKEKNYTLINCTTHPNNPTVYVNTGNETRITKEGNNCYVITISSTKCDSQAALEKFILQSIMDARNRALEKKAALSDATPPKTSLTIINSTT